MVGRHESKLSLAERKWLAEATISAAAGRVPVLVGTSATCIADALALSEHAASVGAVGVFCTPPLHGAVTLTALDAHFGALASAVDLPILIQDALVVVPPAQIARLGAAHPNLRWIKEEALDSGHRISELRRVCTAGVTILSGGSYLLNDLARGAIGAIPGSIGVGDLSHAFDLYVAGDVAAARATYNHFLPLSFWRRQFPLLASKEILRRIGIFSSAHLREPSGETLDDQDLRELGAIMELMGPPY